MNSAAFYRLMLGLPYLLFVPGFFAMRDSLASLSMATPGGSSNGALDLLLAFWGITGIFWIIPYSIFAIGLLLWSLGKSDEKIRAWFTRSPWILMMISPLFFLALSPLAGRMGDQNSAGTLSAYVLIGVVCSAPLSLLFGFIFVGLGLFLHSVLTSLNLIRDAPAPPDPPLPG